MSRLSDRRIAIAAGGVVSAFTGQSFANLGTAGTVVPVPAGAYAVQIRGTVDTVFQAGTALGANPAVVSANTNPVYALHQDTDSVAFAAASGSANLGLNWHRIADAP